MQTPSPLPKEPQRSLWRIGSGDGRKSNQGDAQEWTLANEIESRIESEPLPASSGSGVDGHLLMRWEEWAQALWKQYANVLLRREQDVATWASDSGYATPEPTAVALLNHVPNRHALFADDTPKPTFPYPRNRVLVPMSKTGRLDVSIADYNRFAYYLKNKQPRMNLKPTTIALSPFPRSSSLIITPRLSNEPVPMWEAIAGPVVQTGSRKFDSNFVTYSREPRWARETLTSEMKRWIFDMENVRIMADRDSLVCIYLPGWAPTDELDEIADLAFSISKSARDALYALG